MRERTYTITWSRRPRWDHDIPEQQFCSGLTPRIALARLMAALDEAGCITVHKVERDEPGAA